MRLIRGLPRQACEPCVLTIGSFDGLHLGHWALIERVLERAGQLGLPAGLLSFEPLPREFLRADDPPARLTSFRERWHLLASTRLRRFHVLAFNARLRAMSGGEFMQLLQALGARAVIIGHDFRFARDGATTADWLAAQAANYGFEVEIFAPVRLAGERVSSGLVRSALRAGEMQRAAQLLGRPYTMRARVRRGAQLGRTLGFATANLALHRRRTPLDGIFAVRAHGQVLRERGCDARGWPGVASLGTRPTVNGVEPLLEVHLFDFDGELYRAELEVEFVARLRSELRFDSLDAMVAQMQQDAAAARAILARLV